jgi:kumamolisin
MVIGGTSAAAPLWSGFTALVNQKAAAAGKPVLGEANPKLYAVANSSSYGSTFHDVTTGANQDFSTKTGYDQVTGWGSPVADALTDALLGGSTPVTPPPSGNAITNGDFETGDLTGWTTTGNATADASAAQSGKFGALVGSANPTADDSSISQTFTAPAGSSQVSFSYNVNCDDTVDTVWASATLTDNTTGTTSTVLANTCATGWQTASGTVTPGDSYTLTLANHDATELGDATYTYFDNVSVS